MHWSRAGLPIWRTGCTRRPGRDSGSLDPRGSASPRRQSEEGGGGRHGRRRVGKVHMHGLPKTSRGAHVALRPGCRASSRLSPLLPPPPLPPPTFSQPTSSCVCATTWMLIAASSRRFAFVLYAVGLGGRLATTDAGAALAGACALARGACSAAPLLAASAPPGAEPSETARAPRVSTRNICTTCVYVAAKVAQRAVSARLKEVAAVSARQSQLASMRSMALFRIAGLAALSSATRIVSPGALLPGPSPAYLCMPHGCSI